MILDIVFKNKKLQKIGVFLFLIISFSSKLYCQEYTIDYMYDVNKNIDKNSIEHQNFEPYTKAVNNGFKNGVYWFKIKTTNPFILQIANARITKTNLYTQTTQLKNIENNRFITYKLSKKANNTYYLKVITDKEGYIPIVLKTDKEHENNTTQSLFINGIYYGFAVMILIINLFYFINFKEIKFVKYALLNISITLSIFYSEGLFLFFTSNDFINSKLETLLHMLVAILTSVFIIDYLSIKQKIYLKTLYFISFGLLVSTTLYFTTNQLLYFIVTESLCLVSLLLNWSYGLRFYKKLPAAKIFVFAYAIIFLAAIIFYVPKNLGFPLFYDSIFFLKLGGLIEMLLFTYALVHGMQQLKQENTEMQKTVAVYSNKIEELAQAKKTKQNNLIFNDKEKEIISLLKQQKTNPEIAEELLISINTVKYHLKNIYKKLNVKNRTEITNYPF